MASCLDKEFFAGDTVATARALLGVTLVYGECCGTIVETEAYKDDAASHAVTRPYKGRMLRETYGEIYIYQVYGVHRCLNVTTEKNGVGAVLIRAVEPRSGLDAMRRRRRTDSVYNLASGPAKLFQAFGIKPGHHGEEIGGAIRLQSNGAIADDEVVAGPRVGISKARELPWRFYLRNNKYVSRPSRASVPPAGHDAES